MTDGSETEVTILLTDDEDGENELVLPRGERHHLMTATARSMETSQVQKVDLSEEVPSGPAELVKPNHRGFDFEKSQQWVAITLVVFLGVVVATGCGLMLFDRATPDNRQMVGLLLTSTGSLAGSVVGFYFGERQGKRRR